MWLCEKTLTYLATFSDVTDIPIFGLNLVTGSLNSWLHLAT